MAKTKCQASVNNIRAEATFPILVRLLAPACVGLLFALPAQAQRPDRFAHEFVSRPVEGPRNPAVEKRYTPQFQSCQDKASSTRSHEACFAAEFARQDKQLNRIWRFTLHRFDASSRSRLLTAQRKWLAKRDPFCNSEADRFSGGTIMTVVYLHCRVEETIKRTMWLEKLR